MERFVVFIVTRFSTAVVISALGWLCWRACKVLSKPSDELISLLGLEVPIPPTLSLAGIRADGVILNWKPPDQQKTSIVKHHINVNGISLGELSPLETSIAVAGLKPDNNYIVRVIAVSPLNFQAASEPIRVRTKTASSRDFLQTSGDHEEASDEHEALPSVHPYKSVAEASHSVIPPTMQREHSGSISQQKRIGRRNGPVAAPGVALGETVDSDRDGVTLRELIQKLEQFRDEIEAAEREMAKEDDDFNIGQDALNQQRNHLRQAVTDKENASKSLKKQVADLAGQNSAAQGRRIAAEKQLQQKLQDRQKLRDDVDKWDQEIAAMRTDVERIGTEQANYRDAADKAVVSLQEEHASQISANKILEDTLRQSRSKIDDLRDEKDRHDEPEIAPGLSLTNPSEDVDWSSKLYMVQANFQTTLARLQQAKQYGAEAQMVLESWRQRRLSQPTMFATTPVLDFIPAGRHGQRQSRAMSLRNDQSLPSMTFDSTSGPVYNKSISSISPPFSTVSPFFNVANGTTLSGMGGMAPLEHIITAGMSPSDIELLTAGAPTSPSVTGALLPAGLLGDEMETSQFTDPEASNSRSSPSSGNILPGLGAPQTLEQVHRVQTSPTSPQSRSPSVFPSPRDSSPHLPLHHGPDSVLDSDRRSSRSTASSVLGTNVGVNHTSTRFANLFGFSRQRGKTFSDDGPALGSLSSQESQSFPRDLSDSTNLGRRRGSHTGAWINQMQSVLARSSTTPIGSTNPTVSRRRFNVFGSRHNPWQSMDMSERARSPRQDSTGSPERQNTLPTPSMSTQTRFGWPVSGDTSSQRLATTLGADWGISAATSWSRHPSRRPSITYGGSHNLMDSAYLDDIDYNPQRRSPKLAPIGTRPTSQVSTGSGDKARLNPAAPSFKLNTLFTRDKKSDKGEKTRNDKGERSKSKKEREREDDVAGMTELSSSALNTIVSQDLCPSDVPSRVSLSTTGDATSEGRISLEDSMFQISPEYTSGAKETFMQKLSRKSSTGMFNFPGFTKSSEKVSNRFGKKTSVQGNSEQNDNPDVVDENGNALRPETRETMSSKSLGSEKGATSFSLAGGLSPLMSGRDSKEKDRVSSSGFSFRGLATRGKSRVDEKNPSLEENLANEHAEWEEIEDE